MTRRKPAAFAEGLIIPSLQHTGLAFLQTDMDVKGPTCVEDTIRVEIEVTELLATRKPGRGLVRTRNMVRNHEGVITMVYNPFRMLRLSSAAV